MPYLDIINATKALASRPNWVGSEADTGYLWLETPIEIDGVVSAGLSLHVGCLKGFPDANVSFELRLRLPRRPGSTALDRIDWRPAKRGHTIPNRKNIPWGKGRRIDGSHWHLHEYNITDDGRFLDELPVAIPVRPEPASFEELKVLVARDFLITNIALVSAPPWEYVLL